MSSRRTRLLALLLIVSIAVAGLACGRLVARREAALATLDDLLACRAAIARLRTTPGAAASNAPRLDDLNLRFRSAAISAGLTEQQLPSVEPGRPVRVENTGFARMSIFLGFERLTLQQLVTFLHQLTTADAHCLPEMIELSIPEADADPSLWRADLEIAYLMASSQAPAAPAAENLIEEDVR